MINLYEKIEYPGCQIYRYLRYNNIMNIKNQRQIRSPIQPSIFNSNKENAALATRTERKNSSSNRHPLAEAANIQFKSQSKHSKHSELPSQHSRQIQTSVMVCRESSSQISASKWLDSKKEMMEFILSLKHRKDNERSKPKLTEGFQLGEDKIDSEHYLCNRMLALKKAEKYQKEAISLFYDRQYDKCFAQLSKAQSLLKKQRIDSPQHNLYINYLYAEFYFKIGDHLQWRTYLTRANSFISRISKNQTEIMCDYVMNVKALEVCLLFHDQLYEKALFMAEELLKEPSLSSKVRRRTSNVKVASLKKLCKFKEAMSTIDDECKALQTDTEINSNKKDQQIAKMLTAKIELTAEYISTERAVGLIEQIICFDEVASGQQENFSYYNCQVFRLYLELLRKTEDSHIKAVFLLQKWVELEVSRKDKLKLQLELFREYYQMGIYERSLQLFNAIASENVVYLGPEYLHMLARIKHNRGDQKEAVSIMAKVIDLCQDEEARTLNSYRILEFDLDCEGQTARLDRQKALEKMLKNSGANSNAQLYCEYLRRRGEQERADNLMNMLRKTANFYEFNLNDFKSAKKSSRK